MTPPTDFQLYRIRIDEAITYNDPQKARALIREALRAAVMAENLGERMYFSAQELIVNEDFAGAIKFLDLAIAYNPKDGAAYNDRALCMIDMGDWDDALIFLDRGIAVEPEFATIHHNKGWFLNMLGRHEEALRCFEEALRLSPKRAVTYENIADACVNLGRLNEAISAYKMAISFLAEGHDEIKTELLKLINILKRRKEKI